MYDIIVLKYDIWVHLNQAQLTVVTFITIFWWWCWWSVNGSHHTRSNPLYFHSFFWARLWYKVLHTEMEKKRINSNSNKPQGEKIVRGLIYERTSVTSNLRVHLKTPNGHHLWTQKAVHRNNTCCVKYFLWQLSLLVSTRCKPQAQTHKPND